MSGGGLGVYGAGVLGESDREKVHLKEHISGGGWVGGLGTEGKFRGETKKTPRRNSKKEAGDEQKEAQGNCWQNGTILDSWQAQYGGHNASGVGGKKRVYNIHPPNPESYQQKKTK